MAGDWIKIRVWINRDPKTIRLANLLGNSPGFHEWACNGSNAKVTQRVVTAICIDALRVIWGIAREHGRGDGDDIVLANTDLETLSHIADVPGFGEAMAGVGWAVESDGSIVFPGVLKDWESPVDRMRSQNAERQRRFRARGGGDPMKWTAIKTRILRRDKGLCAYCQDSADSIDHVIPVEAGGGADDWNLVACCRACNRKKGSRTPAAAGLNFDPKFDIESLKPPEPKSNGVRNAHVTHREEKRRELEEKIEEGKNGASAVAADPVELELVSKWNASQGVVKIRGGELSPSRRSKLRARLREKPPWEWREALAKFPLKISTGNGAWIPDIDWLLRPDSVAKVLEGKYDWIPRERQNGRPIPKSLEEQRALMRAEAKARGIDYDDEEPEIEEFE